METHYGQTPITSAFEDTVAAALVNCPPGAVLLAAVSGGADSTAMLAALAAVRDRGLALNQTASGKPAFSLRCIHIEHGIRPPAESRGDAEFVRSLCKKFRIPCRIVSIALGKVAATAKERGIGIEAAARLYRRRAWFREVRRIKDRGFSALPMTLLAVRVLTAHTADDMLETALMRILRGAGPSGLAAMPARRGRLLRPLITLYRFDVLNYLIDRNIAWREDSTNAETKFLRNRIRHCLIPQLNEHFPQWRTTLTALAETQSLSAEFIGDEASRRICWQSSAPHSLCTNAEFFYAQPAIIREEALFQGIDRLLSDSQTALSGNKRTEVRRVNIRRMNIRHFSGGKITAVDLGLLDLRRKGENIVISVKKNRSRKLIVCEEYIPRNPL
ncbi:MAG: tRNA lysidine(34) synthetase TilS [Treponema sp.]|jgi:tRNA(Ile)-lysidine synthase|nr:tRNA lysidine(34) synthetase TilS [Treponema sp.]